MVCIFVLGLFWVTGGLWAQEKTVNLQRIDITKLPEIRVFLTVTDEQKEAILGLTEQELKVDIDGTAQTIETLTSAFEGGAFLAVALLFDRSGSMKNAIEPTKKAGAGFIKRLSENDQIAVITFDHVVKVDSGFTQDRAASEQAVEGIVLGGDTALYDAIHIGLEALRNIGTLRQAVIVLSDGKDTKSRLKRTDVLAEAKSSSVPVFAINLDTEGDANNLKDLSAQTGGSYFEAAAPGDLLSLYQVIADQLNNQYVLTFQSTFGMDERFHGLEISYVDPGGAKVSVKRDYVASVGPGVRRDTVAGLQRQVEKQSVILYVGIGAILGLLFGVVILLVLKLARPGIRILSVLSFGLVLSAAVMGGIIGAIYYYLV